MKTIRQHLKSLPEPYRTQALENAKRLNGNPNGIMNEKCNKAGYAIMCAFRWYATPQGHKYWSDFKTTLS